MSVYVQGVLGEKTCRACGESKPLEEFYRHARLKDGRQTQCKPCSAARHKEMRQRLAARGEVSSKLCECGCGDRTLIAVKTDARNGWVKGQPRRFIQGHGLRARPLGPKTCPEGHAYQSKRLHNGRTNPCPTCSRLYRQHWRRVRLRHLREAAVAALGGACVRCGITKPIEIDHVNDDGYLMARFKPSGGRERSRQPHLLMRMHAEIAENGGQGKYQLLCANCNRLKQLYREDYDLPPTYGPLPVLENAS